MKGQGRPDQLDRLLDEVARGRRRLSDVKDERLREAIRIALRIHDRSTQDPDDYTLLRIRARVLGNLKPRGPSLADHAWTALELLARPAPLITRSVAIAAAIVSLGLGATVASADTLPDDLLYPVKVASEAVRLALADAPEDRAEVELSIAEHRLAEAERLASGGRTSDALVASAMYSQHIAWAAAELAPRGDASDLPRQLESRFEKQRSRAQTLAVTLAADVRSAPAARIIAMIATQSLAPGLTSAQRVADTAAGVAEQLVKVAEQADADADAASLASVVANEPATATAEAAVSNPVVNADRPRAATVETTATQAPAVAAATGANTPRTTASAPVVSAQTPSSRVRDTDRSRAPETAKPAATKERDGGQHASATARPEARSAHEGEVLKMVRRALEETKAAADRAKKHR